LPSCRSRGRGNSELPDARLLSWSVSGRSTNVNRSPAWYMRSLILHLAVSAALTAPLGSLWGQEQPATIPTDLALGLLESTPDAYGSRIPVIVVGRAPDGMPPTLTSAQSASVLGGIADAHSIIVVLRSTLPPNQVLASFDKQLASSGWGPPPPPPDVERGGFVSSAFSNFFGNLYCGNGGAATVAYSPAPRGGTYLKIRYTRDREGSLCAPRQMVTMRLAALKFPVLVPPPGMIQRGGGSANGGDHTETSAQLLGPLGPAEIVPHYLKQLEAAGWKMGQLASSGDVSIASAESRDAEGTLWRGVLMAQRVSDNELEVTLEMSRPSGR
jgi:hypothetical protein